MTRLVPAVGRALEILRLFVDAESLSVPEISKRLALPKSSTHELVQTLVAHRFLAPAVGRPHEFQLDVMVFELGSAYAGSVDLWREAHEVVHSIADITDETTQVAVLDGTDSLYLAKVDSSHPVRLVSEVGKRVPAHCTAGGKVLLSGLSESGFDERYSEDSLEVLTSSSISSVKTLKRELEEVRSQGYARDLCESNPSVCCVAAPIRDRSGGIVAALSVSVPTMRVNDEWPDNLLPVVMRGALSLSARLGYRAVADGGVNSGDWVDKPTPPS